MTERLGDGLQSRTGASPTRVRFPSATLMAISTYKAYYLVCDDCGFSELEFRKKDVRRVVETHDCEKHLRRALLQSNPRIRDRFEVAVSRKG